MQRFIYYILLLFCAISLIGTACTKQQAADDGVLHLSVMQFIAQDPQLDLLHSAILRAGVDSFFVNNGPFTFFAPTDSAFLQAGLTRDKIATYDPVALSYVLCYHILSGRISAKELTGFSRSFPASLNKDFRPNVSKNYYGIFFNGMHVTQGNIQLADGVVHKLDGVSFPTSDSMVKVLERQPDLTLFTAAVKRSKLLLAQLKPDTLTVFAPQDDAFKAIGYTTIDKINNEDTAVLIRLLNSYLCSSFYGRLYQPDLMGNKTVGSVALTLAASLAPNNKVRAVSYGFSPDGSSIIPNFVPSVAGATSPGIVVPPRLVRKNILTKRGIIHIVDQVFVP